MLAAGALLAAGAGAGAKEVASYNRDNFKWDLEQRLERETWRLDMQVKRFELFREDVRDLVKLTVDRMDIYHLVGALFLCFCVTLFVAGRIRNAPTFILMLYLLTNACAFIYMLMAVWLSMHASIAAHSFGVRLLTRFVRLPIPSVKQLDALTYQMRDYEKQGVSNIMRLPFLDRSGNGNMWTSTREDQERMPPDSGGAASSAAAPGAAQTKGSGTEVLLPEAMEAPIGGEDLLTGSSGAMPGRHVQLFRTLQSKWQCYDAYCRVCMGLGLNHLLQAMSYYSACHTIVENHAPTLGVCLMLALQSTMVAVAMLDLAGLNKLEIFFIQMVGASPCFVAAAIVAVAKANTQQSIPAGYLFYWAPICFFLQAIWLQLWLAVSTPSCKTSYLPRRFRQVLFLDVFGDASACTPEASTSEDRVDLGGLEEYGKKEACGKKAIEVLALAQSAVQRWLSAPGDALNEPQVQQLSRLADRFMDSNRAVADELDRLELTAELAESTAFLKEPLRIWEELQPSEQLQDKLRGTLVGPFTTQGSGEKRTYHWNVEESCGLFDDEAHQGGYVLDLPHVGLLIKSLEEAQQKLVECRCTMVKSDRAAPDLPTTRRGVRRDGSARSQEATRSLGCCSRRRCCRQGPCPNLMKIFRGMAADRVQRSSSHLVRPQGCLTDSFPYGGSYGGSLGGSPTATLTPSGPQGERGAFRSCSPSNIESFHPRDGFRSASNYSDSPLHLAGHRPHFESGVSHKLSGQPPGEFDTIEDNDQMETASAGMSASSLDTLAPDRVPNEVPKQDPTLKAMAGQHAQHFVPERLPWLVLSSITRMLQIVWFFAGVFISADILHNIGKDRRGDGARGPAKEARALFAVMSASDFDFERLELSWPERSLFNPIALFSDASRPGELLVASPFAVYRSVALREPHRHLEELHRLRLPAAFSVLCLPDAAVAAAAAEVPRATPSRCLLVSAQEGAVVVGPLGEASAAGGEGQRRLLLAGPRWRQLAGAAVSCSSVKLLLHPSARKANTAHCALLAGWDGARLSVAVAPLRLEDGWLPAAGFKLVTSYDLALSPSDVQRGVNALHIEGGSLRLWILSGWGRLDAWDLRQATHRGSWTPDWDSSPGGEFFRPRAIYDGGRQGLYVVGRGRRTEARLLLAWRHPLLEEACDSATFGVAGASPDAKDPHACGVSPPALLPLASGDGPGPAAAAAGTVAEDASSAEQRAAY